MFPPRLMLILALAVVSRPALAELREISAVDVGFASYELVLTPDGGLALATVTEANAVLVVDVATRQRIGEVPLPGRAGSGLEIAVMSDGARALVTNYSDGTIVQVDLTTLTVVGEPAHIGVQAAGVTLTPDDATVLVAHEASHASGGHTLSIFAPDPDWSSPRTVAEIGVGLGPRMAALSPDGTLAVVPNGNSGDASIVQAPDLASWMAGRVVQTVAIGGQPWGAAVSPSGDVALVTDVDGGIVSVVAPGPGGDWSRASVVRRIANLSDAHGVAFRADGRAALVSGGNSTVVTLLRLDHSDDWATAAILRDAVTLRPTPTNVAITPDGKLGLVNLHHAGEVSFVDLCGEDSDGDGIGDACDCAPQDAGATARPGVAALRLEAGGAGEPQLSWTDLVVEAGEGTRYVIEGGELERLWAESNPTWTELARSSEPAWSDDRRKPNAGLIYRVRGTNSCGFGLDGDGD